MARHKNEQWLLPAGDAQPDGSRSHAWDSIHAALLMDIRDELQTLNALLGCRNFIEVPDILRQIRDRKPHRVTVKQAARLLAKARNRKPRP